jgi:transposase
VVKKAYATGERTSQLDWVAPKIIKRVFIRPRYVKAECFALAPLPPQPIERGMVGPGLLAQILVSKWRLTSSRQRLGPRPKTPNRSRWPFHFDS